MISLGIKIDDRYRVTTKISTGGMAEVYEVNDLIYKKSRAMKVMLPKLLNDNKNVERFITEAEIEAKLSHPNIIKVFNSGEIDNRPYMILEYIKGQTMREKIDFLTNFSFVEMAQYVLQLCSAVSYCHSRGIIHCDIKPDNVFISLDGSVKLSDFGIAIDLNEENKIKEKNNSIMGSVHYLAPEIMQSHKPSFQSDIYSIGITMFELFTKRLPFEDGELVEVAAQHIKNKMPLPSDYVENLPQAINKIILRATEKRPEDRYSSVNELRVDLENFISENRENKTKKGLFARFFGFSDK